MLDVLLEAAVRCRCPSAMRVLLERGSCPDIPCWRLERNSNKWLSALSFAIDAFGEANDGMRLQLADSFQADPNNQVVD